MEKEENSNTKRVEEQHSVKISINAKGQFSGEVKCYGRTPDEAEKRTNEKIENLEKLIREKNKL